MEKSQEPIPRGREQVIAHLTCSPCTEAIEFYKKAFGAKELSRAPSPDGQRLIHAEIEVDGSVVFLADDFPEFCNGKSMTATALGGTPVTLHRYVKDCDAAFEQAVAAGATILMPPMDMFWGDRYATVTDPFGHNWSLATHQYDYTREQIMEASKAAFEQAQQQGGQ